MSTPKGLKGFLLFDKFGNDPGFASRSCLCNILCIVVAESFENVALALGGKLGEVEEDYRTEKIVILPKSLFKPLDEDKYPLEAIEFLEYCRGDVYLRIHKHEEKKVLFVKSFPLLEQEFIEPLNTTTK